MSYFFNSLSAPTFILLNVVVFLILVYYLIREKKKKKYYIPILYVAPMGCIVSIFYKLTSSYEGLKLYIDVSKVCLLLYIIIFLLTFFFIGFKGLKRENDKSINTPVLFNSLVGLAICILFYLVIYFFTK